MVLKLAWSLIRSISKQRHAFFFFGKPGTVKLGDSVTSMSAREKSVNHCNFMLKGRHQRTKEHNFNFFWWSVVSQAKIWLNLFIIPNQLHCKVVLPVLKTVCYETVASPLFTVASFSANQVAISSEGIIESFLFFQWMYASTE